MLQLPALPFFKDIIELSEVGVKQAEQLCKNSKLGKEQRKQYALNYVNILLSIYKLEITSELEKIIDGAIEAAV